VTHDGNTFGRTLTVVQGRCSDGLVKAHIVFLSPNLYIKHYICPENMHADASL